MAVRGDGRPSNYVRFQDKFLFYPMRVKMFVLYYRGINSYFPIFLTIPL